MNFSKPGTFRKPGSPVRRRPSLMRTLMMLGVTTCLAFGPLAPVFAPAAQAQGASNGGPAGAGDNGGNNASNGGDVTHTSPVPAPSNTAVPADDLPSFSPIVEKVLPAVVNISVVQKSDSSSGDDQDDDDDAQPSAPDQGPGGNTPFDDFLRRFFEQQQQGMQGGPHPNNQKVVSLGSGFIIDPSGYVVTNNHVVGDAEKVTVTLADDSQYTAKIIGKDQKSDLALLKITAPKPLPFVRFGDSDKAKVGDWVIAVGNPFGLGGTVTKGIVSARGRPIADSNYVDFLQIDASINRGNSGGPTFNMNGDVIGINTAIYSPNGGSVGIGFAIPSNSARPVIEQLKKSGHVDRGWLGVQIQEVTPDIAASLGLDSNHPTGALVSVVSKDSPAGKAGIKEGDVIQKFDGKTVDKMRDLPRIVAETPIGKKVEIEVYRQGKSQTLDATIEKLDESKTAVASNGSADVEDHSSALGMTLSNLTSDARKRLGVPHDTNGVLVTRVRDNSPAADKGIEAGDIIVSVNEQPVSRPDEVPARVADAKKANRKSVLLFVSRHGQSLYVGVPLDSSAE